MSNYSTLDAHSRNCSACIRQREMMGSGGATEIRNSDDWVNFNSTYHLVENVNLVDQFPHFAIR